jgi:hypothetical protein
MDGECKLSAFSLACQSLWALENCGARELRAALRFSTSWTFTSGVWTAELAKVVAPSTGRRQLCALWTGQGSEAVCTVHGGDLTSAAFTLGPRPHLFAIPVTSLVDWCWWIRCRLEIPALHQKGFNALLLLASWCTGRKRNMRV